MTSPFNWRGKPSIFAGDPLFATLKTGLSRSQTRSDAIARSARETAKNPGTIDGLSRAQKVLADRWQGSVSKARSSA